MKYRPIDGFPYYYELTNNITLKSMFKEFLTLKVLKNVNEDKARFRYEPNKWSIKQVVGHITDHERIKMNRAFLLSRNEKVELWGYDQESLVMNSRFNELSLESLLRGYKYVRKSSISFVDTLSHDQLNRKGMARNMEVTLEAFLRTVIGHEKHHIQIIQDRYLMD